MLGMRLVDGIDANSRDAPAWSPCSNRWPGTGWWSFDGSRWSATQRGWLLGNEVFGRIWAGE